jgi:predicted alpha/beta hydrolase family esterase
MKQQVLLIHGGDPQESYEAYLEFLKNYPVRLERHALRQPGYQEILASDLGENFEVLFPEMPNKRNAKYVEWKIWFEKFLPFLRDDVILIGGSLGAIFLAKYLAENNLPKRIKALFLLAGPAMDNPPEYKLYDFALPEDLSKFVSQAPKVFLYHSQDDSVVPFKDLEFYKHLFPEATVRVFTDRGHFNVERIPELIADIKSLT